MRIVTPKQIVENEFDGLISLTQNLIVKDKNEPYYLRTGVSLHERMKIVREHGEFIIERLEDSKQLCIDMTEIVIDPKEIEGIVRDHFYTGPLSGSTERLTKALIEYMEKL